MISGWAALALRALNWCLGFGMHEIIADRLRCKKLGRFVQCQLRCKMIDKRMWASQTPLRHFKAKIEEKHGVKSVVVQHYTLYINENPLTQSLWIFRHQEKLMGSWLAGIGRRYPEEDREEGLQRLQTQQICVSLIFSMQVARFLSHS